MLLNQTVSFLISEILLFIVTNAASSTFYENFKHIITMQEWESSWNNSVLSAPKLKAQSKGRILGEIRPDPAARGRWGCCRSSAQDQPVARLSTDPQQARTERTYTLHTYRHMQLATQITCTALTQTQAAPAASSCSPLWLSRMGDH